MQAKELIIANKKLAFQNEEKEKRAEELIIANKELAFQKGEKGKRAGELILANSEKEERADELILANTEKAERAEELIIANVQKSKRAAELLLANKELAFQNSEKEKRVAELIIANDEKEKRAKELITANKEKEKRVAELIIANSEKEKRAKELITANKELAFQNREKEKRADELIIANKELAFQNEEKEKRAEELIIANKELVFQNEEKEKRAAEFIIANKKLAFENKEKDERAAELAIANEEKEKRVVELILANEEKEKRADELILANKELAFQNEEKEKRATELNESKTLLASILNSSLAGIMAFKSIRNAEGAIMDFEWQLVNATAAQMTSCSQTELLGKRLLEEMPGNREEGLYDLYVQVVETGISLRHEHYYEHEKVKTWFHTVAIKRFDGFVVTFTNITEQKLAEQGLITTNKVLAFENKEKDKRAAELAIAKEEKEKRADELFLANKELVFQNEQKEKRAAELIIANKELVFQNEEKEKRATELTIAKEKAEESDRLKSAFLTNMSHEIRTPMNGILGFTELLKEPNLSTDDQQDYIQTIQISGARLLNTINSIVDISKIESGLMKVDIKETNINEKMEFTYKFFRPEAEIKGLQLSFTNSLSAKEAIIKTDNEKVYGMLTNLIRNAIKFTYEGSIEFGYEKKGKYLEFFVKDTGVGIPKNQHIRLRFFLPIQHCKEW